MYINDNLNLCELCFSMLPHDAKRCPHCDGIKNISKFPMAIPESSILVGRYCVGKVLGKGGFGITYLCYDLKEKKKVAIKEYLPDTLAHRDSGTTQLTTYGVEQNELFTEGARKFYDEAKLVSRFNGNPNIIGVYELFNANNTTYFVMEYLSGMDMKKYLKAGGRLSEGEVLYIADRVTEALTVVHSMNTFHRDIAPDNIFLSETGEVKLIDFGAARSVMANESKSLSVIIKHGFAPMEQYQRKGKQGPWTDIYALGATLYYALMGNMPDDAMSRFDDPALDFEGVSPELAKIIEKMMAVRIDDRYGDVISLRKDLAALSIPVTPVRIERKEIKNYCQKCSKEIPSGETLCDACKYTPVPIPKPQPKPDTKKKNLVKILLLSIGIPCLALLVAVVGIILAVVLSLDNDRDQDGNTNENDTVYVDGFFDKDDNTGNDYVSDDGVQWLYSEGTLVIFGSGDMDDYALENNEVKVPWESRRDAIETVVIEHGVTSIGDYAFFKCESLRKVTIADSVTNIGSFAFNYCTSLESITVPDSVTSTGGFVFADCSALKEVKLSKKLKTVSKYSFMYCTELVSIDIPDGVTEIGTCAFWNCTSLKNVTLPEGLTKIGQTAFESCTSLKSIIIPSSVTLVESCAFWKCTSLESVIIKNSKDNISLYQDSFYEGAKVTFEGDAPPAKEGIEWSFKDGTLTISGSGDMEDYDIVNSEYVTTPWFEYTLETEKIVIENGVTSIGAMAFFAFENVTSITIPDSVTEIGMGGLAGLSKLKSIKLPANLKKIEMVALFGCSSLVSITIPESVTMIANEAFADCTNLKTVVVENKKDNINIDKTAFPEGVLIQYTK